MLFKEKMMFSIDRIEGNYAVLEENGATQDVPLSELPEGIREGDLLERKPDGWLLRHSDSRRNSLAERRRRLLEEKS